MENPAAGPSEMNDHGLNDLYNAKHQFQHSPSPAVGLRTARQISGSKVADVLSGIPPLHERRKVAHFRRLAEIDRLSFEVLPLARGKDALDGHDPGQPFGCWTRS